MRFAMATVAAALCVTAASSAAPMPATESAFTVAAVTAPVTAAVAVAQEPAKGEVNVKIDTNDGGAWYGNPMWIIIGVVALVVIVLAIALAGRGGGDTTVVR